MKMALKYVNDTNNSSVQQIKQKSSHSVKETDLYFWEMYFNFFLNVRGEN